MKWEERRNETEGVEIGRLKRFTDHKNEERRDSVATEPSESGGRMKGSTTKQWKL